MKSTRCTYTQSDEAGPGTFARLTIPRDNLLEFGQNLLTGWLYVVAVCDLEEGEDLTFSASNVEYDFVGSNGTTLVINLRNYSRSDVSVQIYDREPYLLDVLKKGAVC